MKDYIKETFTSSGHTKLFNYLKELIRLNDTIKKFPYDRKGQLLGIPDNPWFKNYKSRDELTGQIKCLMNILGFVKVEVVLDSGSKVLFSFVEDKKK